MERLDKLETACRDFEEDLVLYYYGDGSEAERSRVEGHIPDCSRCGRFLDDLRKLLPPMAKAKELPQSFWDDYYREVIQKLGVQEGRSFWWRHFFAPLHSWVVPAFGTAAVVILALALTFGNNGWNFLRPANREAIPQEILSNANDLEFFKSMDLVELLLVLEEMDGSKSDLKTVRHS